MEWTWSRWCSKSLTCTITCTITSFLSVAPPTHFTSIRITPARITSTIINAITVAASFCFCSHSIIISYIIILIIIAIAFTSLAYLSVSPGGGWVGPTPIPVSDPQVTLGHMGGTKEAAT